MMRNSSFVINKIIFLVIKKINKILLLLRDIFFKIDIE